MYKIQQGEFPGGPVVKNPPSIAEDTGWIPDPGRFHMSQGSKPMHHNYCAHALEPTSYNY